MTAIRTLQASSLFLTLFFLAGAFARLQAGDLKGVLGLLLCAIIAGALPFAGKLFTHSARETTTPSRTFDAVKGAFVHVGALVARSVGTAFRWLIRVLFRLSAQGASYGAQKFSTSPSFWSGIMLLILGTILVLTGWYHTAGMTTIASTALFISHYHKWGTVKKFAKDHWLWIWLSISVLASLLALVHGWMMVVFWIGVVSAIASVITINNWWRKIGWKNGAIAIGIIFIALISDVTLKTRATQDMVGIIYPLVFLGMIYLIIKHLWNKK